MIWNNKKAVASLLGASLLIAANTSQAHTIALGSINAGAPGSVTIWLGSYHTDAPNEGSLTLNGVTKAFDMVSDSLPTGLTEGSNYFYADTVSGAQGDYDAPTNLTCCSVTRWQGVTFTGLAAGDYAYSISGMFSVDWADWNSDEANWRGMVNIPTSSAGVPEPTSMALFGLGMLGLAGARRRKSQR